MLNMLTATGLPEVSSRRGDLPSYGLPQDFSGLCEPGSFGNDTANEGVSVQRIRLLAPLLASASLTSCEGSLFRPIWAMEAMRRAYNMIRLVGVLDRNAPVSGIDSHRPDFENRLATALAAIFDSLAIDRDEVLRPCSMALRSFAQNLVELFGSAIGNIALSTCVDRLMLPAFQQRALILLTSELVINVLLHAFRDRIDGRVAVELWVPRRGDVTLTVSNNGNFPSHAAQQPQVARCSMAGDLAELLEGNVVYMPRVGGGQIAKVTFRNPRAQ
jgi:two-component sensor histidine kinase